MAYDRNAPHILAIIFDAEEETGVRAVRDMIRVEGADRNAKRRLRRRVLAVHGEWIDQILYEITPGDGAETYTKDVTRHYKPREAQNDQ